MKAIKTLFAVSAIAAAGAANAATIATYSVTIDGVISGLASGTLTAQYAAGVTTKPTAGIAYAAGTGGVATLTDTGTLTIDYNMYNHNPSAGGDFILAQEVVFQGTIAGGTYTATSGTSTTISCLGVTVACPSASNLHTGVPQPLTATPATGAGGGLLQSSLNIAAGGTNTSQANTLGGALKTGVTYNFTNTTAPAVPVPAAAWLFGSGLLGLAGTARRRRNA